MSSQDSLQAQSNTFGGTKSRKGIVMDLFDHGPVLMVIGGQLIKVDSLSISFELFNSIVFEDATISSYHRDGEDTELTFEAEDYTPSVNWNSQFA